MEQKGSTAREKNDFPMESTEVGLGQTFGMNAPSWMGDSVKETSHKIGTGFGGREQRGWRIYPMEDTGEGDSRWVRANIGHRNSGTGAFGDLPITDLKLYVTDQEVRIRGLAKE